MADQQLFAGRFEVVDIRRGGMAEVLILRDIHERTLVAAKTPWSAPALFSREARLWLGLGYHPNVVYAHTVHNVHGRPYIFMDFVGDRRSGDSHTLRDDISNGPLATQDIVKLGLSVIKALKHAQHAFPGFVHRDLKPENILVDENGKYLVSDFGIGHIPKYGHPQREVEGQRFYDVISPETLFTHSGNFQGTIGYAAPEQYIDCSSVTVKSDIYSLGIILYESLTGTLPFKPEQILHRGHEILKGKPQSDFSFLNSTAKSLMNIVLNMLAFYAGDRPKSLEELEQNFESLSVSLSDSIVLDSKNRNNTQDKATMLNRIYSFIQLHELSLAKRAILQFQKRYPWHYESPMLIRALFENCNKKDDSWDFLKEAAFLDLSNPIKVIPAILFGLVALTPLVLTYSTTQYGESTYIAFMRPHHTIIDIIVGIALLLALFFEKYINVRTAITLDKITLPGLALGILSALLFNALGYPLLSGAGKYSFFGVLIAFSFTYGLAWASIKFLKKDGVGGGTIKLATMIGSFVGLLIIPIIAVAVMVVIFQGAALALLLKISTSELIWVDGRLSPSFLSKYRFRQITTSTPLMFATWVVISWAGLWRMLGF